MLQAVYECAKARGVPDSVSRNNPDFGRAAISEMARIEALAEVSLREFELYSAGPAPEFTLSADRPGHILLLQVAFLRAEARGAPVATAEAVLREFELYSAE
ncbi:MAG: hypothetical protein LAQ30_30690 [Acidobacteriia bacterium]|nr:hypothetical protein [Terriglobia bacterium]